jgi:serine/threonine protein kinase
MPWGSNLTVALEPGRRFGRYQVTESIGSGGMGEVYRATDTVLKRDVALKALPQTFVDDTDRLARLQREAEILASLNHPNIAQVFGLEQSDGQTAIVMELVEGPTLADRIRQGPIPVTDAIDIPIQISNAMEAAHARAVVHRDLKPVNIKLREDGVVKVSDFGIAKTTDQAIASSGPGSPESTTPALTETGIILGTAANMSPDQARGKPLDARQIENACLAFDPGEEAPINALLGASITCRIARVRERTTRCSRCKRYRPSRQGRAGRWPNLRASRCMRALRRRARNGTSSNAWRATLQGPRSPPSGCR